MRTARKKPTPTIVRITRNICATGISCIRTLRDKTPIDVVEGRRASLKALCVDSESRFLAIKKFFVLAGFASLRARQNRSFGRIAATDSAARFFAFTRCVVADGEQSVHDRARREAAAMPPASHHASFRCRVCSSASRSPLADWPCRRMTSSPGRRTSRSAAASPGPARPCPDWRR